MRLMISPNSIIHYSLKKYKRVLKSFSTLKILKWEFHEYTHATREVRPKSLPGEVRDAQLSFLFFKSLHGEVHWCFLFLLYFIFMWKWTWCCHSLRPEGPEQMLCWPSSFESPEALSWISLCNEGPNRKRGTKVAYTLSFALPWK